MVMVWANRRAVLAGVTSTVSLSGCGLVADIYRYRFSIEIEVEGFVRRATAVQGYLHRTAMPGMAVMDYGEGHTVGEALVVDLGERGVLFATFARWTRLQSGAPVAQAKDWSAAGAVADFEPENMRTGPTLGFYKALAVGVPVNLTAAQLPVLVTFRDRADSRSVVGVDPKDLAATFGPGVRLSRAWVEGSHGFITRGRVKQFLPWAAAGDEIYLSKKHLQTANNLVDTLTNHSFIGK